VLNLIAERRNWIKQAKSIGITISKSELEAYISNIRQGLKQLKGDELTKFHDSLAGQGYKSEDEYFADQKVIKAYENSYCKVKKKNSG